MMSNENYKAGEKMRRAVLGDKRVDATMADPDDFARILANQWPARITKTENA